MSGVACHVVCGLSASEVGIYKSADRQVDTHVRSSRRPHLARVNKSIARTSCLFTLPLRFRRFRNSNSPDGYQYRSGQFSNRIHPRFIRPSSPPWLVHAPLLYSGSTLVIRLLMIRLSRSACFPWAPPDQLLEKHLAFSIIAERPDPVNTTFGTSEDCSV